MSDSAMKSSPPPASRKRPSSPTVSAPIKLSFPPTRGFWEIPVLYEDEHVLALDKPPALATSPDRANPQLPALMPLLHGGIRDGKAWATDRQLTYLANAHRLEAGVSGVILLARSKAVLGALVDQFASEKPLKTCLVMCWGAPAGAELRLDGRLAPDPRVAGRFRVDPAHGKKAVTLVRLEEAFRECSLLRCRLLTDRPHQLRVHLQRQRLPVVGDALYRGRPLLLSELKPGYRLKPGATERPLLARMAIHLAQVRFVHPVTGVEVTVDSPTPHDFEVGLKYLRRFSARTW